MSSRVRMQGAAAARRNDARMASSLTVFSHKVMCTGVNDYDGFVADHAVWGRLCFVFLTVEFSSRALRRPLHALFATLSVLLPPFLFCNRQCCVQEVGYCFCIATTTNKDKNKISRAVVRLPESQSSTQRFSLALCDKKTTNSFVRVPSFSFSTCLRSNTNKSALVETLSCVVSAHCPLVMLVVVVACPSRQNEQ